MTIKETLQRYFTAPQGRIVAWVIIVFISLLILKNIGNIIYSFKRPVVTPTSTETNQEQEAPKVEDIAKWHLLGEVPKPAVETENLPKSMLNVSLVGIFSATPISDAMIAIKLPDEKEEIYKEGDKLPDDVVIYKILPDRVIIKRGDRYEVLLLPEEKIKFEPPLAPVDFEHLHD